jgi:hypothetical protein
MSSGLTSRTGLAERPLVALGVFGAVGPITVELVGQLLENVSTHLFAAW